MKRWVILVVILGIVGSAFAAGDIEKRARKLEDRLMAPCCMANTVAEHYSPSAFAMRQEIREMLAAGKTEDEILEYYVEEHGSLILSRPAAKGFSFLAYGLPIVLFPLGTVFLFVWLRRVRRKDTSTRPQQKVSEVDPKFAERIRREIQDLG
jgi:cytochrome c-type biogenesis protein CcmH